MEKFPHVRSAFESPSADEQFISGREATRLLQVLDLHEALAESAETARDGLLRQAFASRYRELLGIETPQRHELRNSLQNPDSLAIDGLVASLMKAFYELKGLS